MRLVKVTTPFGKGEKVAQIAFLNGIKQVSIQKAESLQAGGERELKEIVDFETSTPKAAKFINALQNSDFYSPQTFSLASRQPRSIVSSENLDDLTEPLAEPSTDITQELWQFTQITFGFVGRIFIASCLLAYGIVESKLLLIIAGLLFLPLLPLLLAIGFGTRSGQSRLAGRGFLAFSVAVILMFSGGITIGFLSSPPVKFDDFSSLPVGLLISLAVGIAAALANIDDVGKRELIGLAATAQIALIPVWFGVCTVLGFPATVSQNEILTRLISFGFNTLIIIIGALAIYFFTTKRMKK